MLSSHILVSKKKVLEGRCYDWTALQGLGHITRAEHVELALFE